MHVTVNLELPVLLSVNLSASVSYPASFFLMIYLSTCSLFSITKTYYFVFIDLMYCIHGRILHSLILKVNKWALICYVEVKTKWDLYCFKLCCPLKFCERFLLSPPARKFGEGKVVRGIRV